MGRNVACIDLALTNTGWVVADLSGKETIVEVGIIKTPPASAKQAKSRKQTVGELDWARSQKLATELKQLLTEHDVQHVYVECPTGGAKSSRAAKSMALAKGAASAVCAGLGLTATLFTPQQAKKAATGSNNATKSEVKNAALKEFSYYDGWVRNSKGALVKGVNEHIFDACSVLMCARRTSSYKELNTNV